MLTSCLQEQASKDVVACQVAWPPAGPLDNRTATTGAANRHLFGFDRNRVRFEPESLFAITGMRNHTLQIKAGRYTSRIHSFDTAAGEIVDFRCNGARIWPLYVASIVKPDLAISLKRE